MILKSGLRALALGVAMVCGAAAHAGHMSIDALPGTAFAFSVSGSGTIQWWHDLEMAYTTDPALASWDVVTFGEFNWGGSDQLFATKAANGTAFEDLGSFGTGRFTTTLTITTTVLAMEHATLTSVIVGMIYPDSLILTPILREPAGSDQALAAPIPAAAPMLASALGIGAFVGWRRRRAKRSLEFV